MSATIPAYARGHQCANCGRWRSERHLVLKAGNAGEHWAERWYCDSIWVLAVAEACYPRPAPTEPPQRYAGLPCPRCGSGHPDCRDTDPATGKRHVHEDVCWVQYAPDVCPDCAEEMSVIVE